MKRWFSIVCLLLGILTAGCTLPLPDRAENAPTPDINATPTVDTPTMRAYPLGPVDVCLVKKFAAVETDQRQGDLLAWAPNDHRLAYLAPPNEYWSSYLGLLRIIDLDLPDQEPFGGDAVSVFGDLTWSPDGSVLAFVILRPSEKVYSVMVYQPSTGSIIDLFPADMAHTDDYASMKSVVGWVGARTLEVTASGGEDLLQILRVDLSTNTVSAAGETRKMTDTSLDLSNGRPVRELEGLPDRMLYWAPNNDAAVYLDDFDLPWLVEVDKGIQFPIPTQNIQSASEVKWSSDSRLLALRFLDTIEVYQTNCKP